jgi:hypothetical protein
VTSCTFPAQLCSPQVVVVMFCKEFFTSESCRTEALLVAQNAPDGRFLYVPVFLYATVEEVKELATDVWAARTDGKALVSEVGGGRCMYRHMWWSRCVDSWYDGDVLCACVLCPPPPRPPRPVSWRSMTMTCIVC